MMIRKCFVTLLAVLLFYPAAGWCAATAIDLSDRTPANAVVRSVIFPGWGQYFNYQEKKAYIVAGTFAASLIAAYVFYKQADDTYKDYKAKGLRNDPLYDDYEKQYNQGQTASLIAAGIWVYGVVDAYLVGTKISQSDSAEGVSVAPDKDGIMLSYRKRF